MPLEDLLAKVKENKKEKKLTLEREHKQALEDLDSKKREEFENLKDNLEKRLKEEKEDLLSKKEREEAFRLEMERLQKKKELLEKAKKEAIERLSSLSAKEKKEIYLKNLKDKKEVIEESSQIMVPKGKKKELTSILKEAEIKQKPVEKDLPFKEGYLILGGKWTLEITLENILSKEIGKNKKEYVDTLFNADN